MLSERNQEKRFKLKLSILVILLVIWNLMIFSFSLQKGEISSDTSSEMLHSILNILTVTGIYSACDITGDKFRALEGILRTVAHFTEFFILGFLAGKLISFSSGRIFKTLNPKKKKLLIYILPIIYCVLVALIDETIQLFVPNRAFEIKDILIDSSGAILGSFLALTVFKSSKQKIKNKKIK